MSKKSIDDPLFNKTVNQGFDSLNLEEQERFAKKNSRSDSYSRAIAMRDGGSARPPVDMRGGGGSDGEGVCICIGIVILIVIIILLLKFVFHVF